MLTTVSCLAFEQHLSLYICVYVYMCVLVCECVCVYMWVCVSNEVRQLQCWHISLETDPQTGQGLNLTHYFMLHTLRCKTCQRTDHFTLQSHTHTHTHSGCHGMIIMKGSSCYTDSKACTHIHTHGLICICLSKWCMYICMYVRVWSILPLWFWHHFSLGVFFFLFLLWIFSCNLTLMLLSSSDFWNVLLVGSVSQAHTHAHTHIQLQASTLFCTALNSAFGICGEDLWFVSVKATQTSEFGLIHTCTNKHTLICTYIRIHA